jgi:hypothetical protein
MEKDLLKSKNVKLLISRMEPDKKYFPFQLRELTKLDHESLYFTRRLAQDYGLIRQENLSGRLYLYTLTEKGKEYRDKLILDGLLADMVETRRFFENVEKELKVVEKHETRKICKRPYRLPVEKRKIRKRPYHRLPVEKREKLMELLEKEISAAQISRMLGISHSTVYRYKGPDLAFQEFKTLLKELEECPSSSLKLPEGNIYFSILRCLCENNSGIRYRQLKNRIGKNVAGELRKLKREKIVDYKDKRYWLKNKELCKIFSY